MQNLSSQEKVTELSEVYETAGKMGVAVIGYKLPVSKALSVMDSDGRCFIGIDESRRYSEREEKTMLIHELGHCATGAFYNEFSEFAIRSKCEKKADAWAITTFLPYDKIISAYKAGICENWELAEYFGVSEQFVAKAVEFYLQRGVQYEAFGKVNQP